MCPKWYTNHGSVTANGLTGPVDVLYGLKWKSLELKRLNGARRVHYHRVNRTSQRHKCTASIEYVSLIGLRNHTLQASGVLARFRDIDFHGYKHCVNPNTPIEAIQNPARQYQSRDVKVGGNPTAWTLSFGKEIEEHTIQQGSVRVNTGMQQDVGELATHTSPLSCPKPLESTPPLAVWEGIHATFVKMPSDLAESAPPTGIHATCWNAPKIREPTRKCEQKLIDDSKPL
ncbi:hypothetical protein R3P38DRAFT_2791172 [Favolaschia claudopus]|uniref:Uncharacterized protein n=1 Tax=Favolaschia claudopus TaxID=2862362 RepID=A0AAW0AGZ5_9AGAR